MFPDAIVTLDVTHEKETERQTCQLAEGINAGYSHKRTYMFVLTLV